MTPSSRADSSKLDHLDRLKSKIVALRAKTIENGCTEQEALMAAKKVSELLDSYDLSLTDIEMSQASCERLDYKTSRKKNTPIHETIPAIADFTDCRTWRERDAEGKIHFVFFGRSTDILIAHYLCDVIASAMAHDLVLFKKTELYRVHRTQDRRRMSKSFLQGMANSISHKLRTMKIDREAYYQSQGRDLVLLKTSLVDEELKKLGLKFIKRRQIRRTIAFEAYQSGQKAGEKLSIHSALTEEMRSTLGKRG
jgi:hypothetical protein